MPSDAEFVGFVVWLREHDEFLGHLEYGSLTTKRTYVVAHESSVTTSTYSHAEGKRRLRGSQRFFDSWILYP